MCELPFSEDDDLNVRQYVVWGGSNRVRIAEELGYKLVDHRLELFGKKIKK